MFVVRWLPRKEWGNSVNMRLIVVMSLVGSIGAPGNLMATEDGIFTGSTLATMAEEPKSKDQAIGTHLRDFSPLPIEPEEFDDREVKAYYDWRNDLFFREFDMKATGTVNYMTARRTYKVWLDEFGTPVVITVGAPLFYWLDLNGNGNFETSKGEMWSDPDEDGITGNERIYDTSHLENHPSRIPQWSAPIP